MYTRWGCCHSFGWLGGVVVCVLGLLYGSGWPPSVYHLLLEKENG
jgi:hypothetical protein